MIKKWDAKDLERKIDVSRRHIEIFRSQLAICEAQLCHETISMNNLKRMRAELAGHTPKEMT